MNFINGCGFRDVPITGATFTWSNFQLIPFGAFFQPCLSLLTFQANIEKFIDNQTKPKLKMQIYIPNLKPTELTLRFLTSLPTLNADLTHCISWWRCLHSMLDPNNEISLSRAIKRSMAYFSTPSKVTPKKALTTCI